MTTLTVSQLNRQIRSWLEHEIGEVSVIGELSNLSKPISGHFYFTLKDQSAQVKCVFFRNYHQKDSKLFQDGQQALVRGRLSFYEARGDYQLIVHELSPYGLGELYKQFELLKTKLQSLGYFAAERKKAIPLFPQSIAVITSVTGAALHDILTTLARRYPIAEVRIYGSEVQGQTAAGQLVKALKQANQDQRCDVIVLARGGGSIEDLWAFNDEQLALAIAESKIPVVSGVGHETDFTIADFVADLRAATPTAAAEAVTPNQFDLIQLIHALINRMSAAIYRAIEQQQSRLSHRIAQLESPEQLIFRHWQALDYLQKQLNQQLQFNIQKKQHELRLSISQLHMKNPVVLMKSSMANLNQLQQQLRYMMIKQFDAKKQSFSFCLSTLHAISPLATLARGYSIATHQQTILYHANQVNTGDKISVRLAKGQLSCLVLEEIEHVD